MLPEATVESLKALMSLYEATSLVGKIEVLDGNAMISLKLIEYAIFLPGHDQLLFEIIDCSVMLSNLTVHKSDLMIHAHEQLVEVTGAFHFLAFCVLEDEVRLSVPLPPFAIVFQTLKGFDCSIVFF